MHDYIHIRGAREHNLQNVDLDIPRDQLVVITGLSGSGKSSLAFDTIYAEGQRRYMESLSAYARQFLGMMERPEVDFIDGLSPVIAIEQKTVSRNPRSTVGTVTEIYDFLRLLFARAGEAYSYLTGNRMRRQSDDEIIDGMLAFPEGTQVMVLAPVVKGRKGHYRELFESIAKQGYERVRVDGQVLDVTPGMKVDRYKVHDIEVVVDRLVVRDGLRARVAQSVEAALLLGQGQCLAFLPKENRVVRFSRYLVDPDTGLSYDEPSPNTFSFNSPYGACPDCEGLGTRREVDPDLVFPHPAKSIRQGGILPMGKPRDTWAFAQLKVVAEAYGYTFDTPLGDLTPEQRHVLMDGAGDRQFLVAHTHKGREVAYEHRFTGMRGFVENLYEQASGPTQKRFAEGFMRSRACSVCGGARLKPEARAYRFGGKSLHEIVTMDLPTLRTFLAGLTLEGRQERIAAPILKEITERIDFLVEVGIDYLTLDRSARSLSGGESQRIRLATQIGTQLTGVLYVLDEPSIGLHPRDNTRLIQSLKRLRNLGNSVLVVEHDREMIEAADYVVDMGPGAGELGGMVVSEGTPDTMRLREGMRSLTLDYLAGERTIPMPRERAAGNGKALVLKGARGHNLKGDTLSIPLGTFTCVTGVSGSGKSSLINQTLSPILANHFHRAQLVPLAYDEIEGLKAVDKVIAIDQTPIGRTPRSNPATYTGLFNHLRDLFALLPESKIRGYKPGRFSFNVSGGRCEHCEGAGIVKLEMNFLPDVYVPCEVCHGQRYNPETLEVRYKGKTIAEVLNMTVDDALAFFEAVPRIERKLRTLAQVGLGYVRLGQQATTLSGGEAQRIKLAKELSRPGTGQTLYILDEPTTGLHFEDVRHLLAVLRALVKRGNTVLVIEHNLDVVKVADHVIDLGPGGGLHGGKILFSGTPEALAEQDTPTAYYLREELKRSVYSDQDVLDLGEFDASEDAEEQEEEETAMG